MFHRNERPTVMLADFVNRADVRVIQSRSCSRFATEPFKGKLISRDIIGKELQRNGAAKLGVFGLVNELDAQ